MLKKMKGKIVRVKLGKENLHDRIKLLQLWNPDKELQDVEVWDDLTEQERQRSVPGTMTVTFSMVKAELEDWTSDVSGYRQL